MQKIKQIYRSTYTGEELIRTMNYIGGEWVKDSEFIPNVIDNKQISGKAVVLGNGTSRTHLHPDLFGLLKNNRGGLFGAKRVQTYGCNAILRDFSPEFTVANDPMAAELVNKGLCDLNIIYGTAQMVQSYPTKFYLVPQNPNWDAGSTAAYLACFDGHAQVYLMGFDGHTGDDSGYHYNVYSGTYGYPGKETPSTERFFEESLLHVMQTYSDVDFVRVVPSKNFYMPESWKYQLNLRQIEFRDFVYEADLG
jgi:hypothetical protein